MNNKQSFEQYFFALISILISLLISLKLHFGSDSIDPATIDFGVIWCIGMPTLILTCVIYPILSYIPLLFSNIASWLHPSYIDNSYCQKFFVEYVPTHSKQEADVEVIHIKQFKKKGKNLFLQEDCETIYILKNIHWRNGEVKHYNLTSPTLEIGKDSTIIADKDLNKDNQGKYAKRVIFTGEIYVPDPPKSNPQKEYEEYKNRCNNAKKQTINEINKVFGEKIDFEGAARIIADYHYRLNLEISKEMDTKKHPAPNSAAILKSKSDQLKEIEMKYKILLYKQGLYEELIPELKLNTHISLDDLDKMTIKELNEMIKANKIK